MKTFLPLLLSIFITTFVSAQTPEDYFHSGAQSFINAELEQAINEVQTGLRQFPNDPKLNALLQKLQEEKQRKQQQQQQNQNQQQQNQDQEQQEQEQQQENQQQQEQQNQEQQKQEEGDDQKGENQDQESQQQMNPEDMKRQKISKEEAEKILQALAQKEKELLKEFKKKKTDGSSKHEKDW